MNILDLMELGKKYNFSGTYSQGENQYKFEDGFMYTLRGTTEWVRPNIASYWLEQEFTIEKLTKREKSQTLSSTALVAQGLQK